MNAQSAPIENYFTRAGIPHKIVGGQRFNDRKEVKDIHSYLSVVANPQDDLRLRRIINEPARKIGATTLENMAQIAAAEGIPMIEVCGRAAEYAAIRRASAALLNFYSIYKKLCEMAETYPLDVFVNELLSVTGYKAMLETQGEEGQERLQNLGQLVSNVRSYADQKGPDASLAGYLEEIALISDIDSYNADNDQVVLMTIHSAKGLEFPYVFLVGMEEGVFPGEMSRYSEEDMEEERRLAYVGITRAKKQLYLSSSAQRMLYGQTRRNEPSRFVREILPEYMEESCSPALERAMARGFGSFGGAAGWSRTDTVPGGRSGYSGGSGWGRSDYGSGSSYGGKAPRGGYLNPEYNAADRMERPRSGYSGGSGWGSRQTSAATSSYGSSGSYGGFSRPAAPARTPAAAPAKPGSKNYKPGDLVEHKVFGRGTVLEVTPTAGDLILKIRFDKVGEKKTMANFAPLKKLEPGEKG